ncbi:hypothetical protein I3843_01G010500 [Carya illinoinensis]|nr:hypothetical protein I3843_01G010500 [Carya illinoinensis]
MAQAEANLELVIEAESTLSRNDPPEVAPWTFLHTAVSKDDVNLDEGDIITTLNPDFMSAPPTAASYFPPSFNVFGVSLRVEDVEGPSMGATTIVFGSLITSIVSNGITLEMPFVILTISPMGSLGLDASRIRMSIPSSPFGISPIRGGEPYPTFPIKHPFVEPSQASPN